MGPKLWNTLPKHINKIESFGVFKGALTYYILEVPQSPRQLAWNGTTEQQLFALLDPVTPVVMND